MIIVGIIFGFLFGLGIGNRITSKNAYKEGIYDERHKWYIHAHCHYCDEEEVK